MEFIPLLTAAETANWIFGSILSLLTLTLILLVAVALRRRAARKKAGAAPRPAGMPAAAVYPAAPARPVPPPAAEGARENLMGSLLGREELEKEPPREERPLDDKTIDKHYADHRGQWVCRYCETINDRGLVLCQACGQPRN